MNLLLLVFVYYIILDDLKVRNGMFCHHEIFSKFSKNSQTKELL